MSSATGPVPARHAERTEAVESEHGHGWLMFAGTMLAIIGSLNIVYGIAAIDDAHVYVGNAKYVFADLNTWGWLMLCVGAVQFLAAFSIWNQTRWGRWVGLITAGGNAVLMLLYLPAFPLLALAIFAVDVLVIYGLVAYGGRPHAA